MKPTKPLLSHRVRKINGSFAFIEHRFVRDGFFTSLNHHELVLYLFLVLAGDRAGMSYYSYDKLCALTRLILDEYIEARNALIDKNLIAFDGRFFQVLSLPQKPVACESKRQAAFSKSARNDAVALCQLIADSLGVSHER